MGAYTIQRPTARRLTFVVQIGQTHSPEDSKEKLDRFQKELRSLIEKHKLKVARRPRPKK